ncbi:hypothetical protein T484DRAFT_2615523 [Baffinella frigidus]|nr:hypothetical protein T484DRAFT_2615523 [Cryptophyta sp. CCMP2293]
MGISGSSPKPAAPHEDVVRLADALAARVKAVAFDMDQCMVAQHSHGRLSKEGLPEYLSKVSPDFVALVPELESRGIHLAVTTHSDRAEYSDSVRPETHVLGEDLVESVLAHSVPRHKEGFFVVAYNPRVRLQAKLLLNLNMTGGAVRRRPCQHPRHGGLPRLPGGRCLGVLHPRPSS